MEQENNVLETVNKMPTSMRVPYLKSLQTMPELQHPDAQNMLKAYIDNTQSQYKGADWPLVFGKSLINGAVVEPIESLYNAPIAAYTSIGVESRLTPEQKAGRDKVESMSSPWSSLVNPASSISIDDTDPAFDRNNEVEQQYAEAYGKAPLSHLSSYLVSPEERQAHPVANALGTITGGLLPSFGGQPEGVIGGLKTAYNVLHNPTARLGNFIGEGDKLGKATFNTANGAVVGAGYGANAAIQNDQNPNQGLMHGAMLGGIPMGALEVGKGLMGRASKALPQVEEAVEQVTEPQVSGTGYRNYYNEHVGNQNIDDIRGNGGPLVPYQGREMSPYVPPEVEELPHVYEGEVVEDAGQLTDRQRLLNAAQPVQDARFTGGNQGITDTAPAELSVTGEILGQGPKQIGQLPDARFQAGQNGIVDAAPTDPRMLQAEVQFDEQAPDFLQGGGGGVNSPKPNTTGTEKPYNPVVFGSAPALSPELLKKTYNDLLEFTSRLFVDKKNPLQGAADKSSVVASLAAQFQFVTSHLSENPQIAMLNGVAVENRLYADCLDLFLDALSKVGKYEAGKVDSLLGKIMQSNSIYDMAAGKVNAVAYGLPVEYNDVVKAIGIGQVEFEKQTGVPLRANYIASTKRFEVSHVPLADEFGRPFEKQGQSDILNSIRKSKVVPANAGSIALGENTLLQSYYSHMSSLIKNAAFCPAKIEFIPLLDKAGQPVFKGGIQQTTKVAKVLPDGAVMQLYKESEEGATTIQRGAAKVLLRNLKGEPEVDPLAKFLREKLSNIVADALANNVGATLKMLPDLLRVNVSTGALMQAVGDVAKNTPDVQLIEKIVGHRTSITDLLAKGERLEGDILAPKNKELFMATEHYLRKAGTLALARKMVEESQGKLTLKGIVYGTTDADKIARAGLMASIRDTMGSIGHDHIPVVRILPMGGLFKGSTFNEGRWIIANINRARLGDKEAMRNLTRFAGVKLILGGGRALISPTTLNFLTANGYINDPRVQALLQSNGVAGMATDATGISFDNTVSPLVPDPTSFDFSGTPGDQLVASMQKALVSASDGSHDNNWAEVAGQVAKFLYAAGGVSQKTPGVAIGSRQIEQAIRAGIAANPRNATTSYRGEEIPNTPQSHLGQMFISGDHEKQVVNQKDAEYKALKIEAKKLLAEYTTTPTISKDSPLITKMKAYIEKYPQEFDPKMDDTKKMDYLYARINPSQNANIKDLKSIYQRMLNSKPAEQQRYKQELDLRIKEVNKKYPNYTTDDIMNDIIDAHENKFFGD